MSEAIDQLRSALRRAGIDYEGPITADGKLQRFRAEGDNGRNSWYVLHPGPPAAGMFGCWKRGFKENWCENVSRDFTDSEWKAIHNRWSQAEAERKGAEKERHSKAQKTAAWILNRTNPASVHPYLASKSVKALGDVCEYRGALVLPLRDCKDELCSLQFISGEGTKRFLAGGRTAGCFFKLIDDLDGPLVIAEGYATAASIHEATGYAAFAAMNCGNLLAVAKALRAKRPDRVIIVAGDDDRDVPGNPGRTKAAECAKQIGAKLALPVLPQGVSGTDFNDLSVVSGLAEVKRQIEAATKPAETDSETFDRLAKLSPAEYDRVREPEAKRLGIRTPTLDAEVLARRSKPATAQGREVCFPVIELWREAVDGAQVLSEIAATFERYVALPGGASTALALWCAHAHVFQAFTCSPRLSVQSATKGCGKTTLRDVIGLFVPRPLPAESLSTAVLFRVIEKHAVTLLADEADCWLADNEELRALLNSGHRRGGQALRCEGEANEVRAFNVFGPAALAQIGEPPPTLADRSITIRLTRAKVGELSTRLDLRHTEREQELCRKLARWCSDHFSELEKSDPLLPSGCYNRVADCWRPLFAIAACAGGDWPQRCSEAFTRLATVDDSLDLGCTLLADVFAIFSASGMDKLPSESVSRELASMEGKAWAEYGKGGKAISPNQLARQLRKFSVSPRTLKLADGKTAKGYHREDFSDAWDRFLAQPPLSNRNPVTDSVNTRDSSLSKPSPQETGLRIENAQNPRENAGGYGVTFQNEVKEESQLAQADLI